MDDVNAVGRPAVALLGVLLGGAMALTGCQGMPENPAFQVEPPDYEYVVGAGDSLNIFVWRNPEVSQTVTVRPDGKISTPLVEDLVATGKTPTQIAREIEQVLSTYIKEPIATVIVGGFVGPYDKQIRILGEAANPQALPYRANMTLLDVMIAVGGLTEFADGNRAVVTRWVDGQQVQTGVRLQDLVREADITANIPMQPGDILMIPESWF
jgi:polysaccharide export outer membrane protein